MSEKKYVPGIGPSDAKIAIIGEAPGAEEENTGLPFQGSAGRLLNTLLSESGIERSQCYVTNVVKYRPPGNDFSKLADIGISLESSINDLRKELETLNPNVLIALGNHALMALTGKTGISKYRGSVLLSLTGNFKVIPTIHPAALLWQKDKVGKNSGQEIPQQIVVADLAKALKESHTRELTSIPRRLEIVKSAFQLEQFINSYRGCNDVSVDIETFKGIPICIALAFNPNHAISVPLLAIPGRDGGINLTRTELVEIYQVLARFFSKKETRCIGQNFKFDHEKLITLSRLIPAVHGKLAADTSLMMGVAYTEFKKNLALMASLFTNEPYWKDEGKEFNPKKDLANQLLSYNAKDAAVTFEIKLALDKELEEFGATFKRDVKGFYYNYVNRLHDFYMDIEAEGLNVDFDRRNELISEYTRTQIKLQEELNSLTGYPVNVKSSPQVGKLLFDDLKLPRRANAQEDTLVALIGNHTKPNSRESKIIDLILRIRQVRTNFSYLKAEPDPDGLMRTTYRITGTETGRTSTGTLGSPIRPWDSGMAFQTIPKHGPFAKLVRSIFVAPEGYLFLEADLSQAEARIVAILANDQETLKLFDTTDIHNVTSGWIFGENKEVTPDERFIGKKARHSGNYGTGKYTLMMSTNSDAKKFGINVQISEKEAARILEVFHAKTPRIRRVFQAEVKEEVHSTRTLFNPFGRMRQFFGNLKDEELYAHLPQSTVSDHLRKAGLRIKDRLPSIRFCVESHDAFMWKISEDKIEEYSKVIKEELERPIDFSRCSLPRGELIIPCEMKVGNRYSELKKL